MDTLQAAYMRARHDDKVVRRNQPAPVMAVRETILGTVSMPEPLPPPEPTVFDLQAAAYNALTGKVTRIQRTVAEFYGVSLEDMLGTRHYARFVTPRHVALWLCLQLTNRSKQDIGKRFGGRDHSTMYNAIRRIDRMMLSDRELVDEIKELRARLT